MRARLQSYSDIQTFRQGAACPESSQREPQNKDRGMQVILTHENADFDAIASLLAAHKLYTRARNPVLPHRINRNVRAFLSLYGSRFSLVDPDTLDRIIRPSIA